MKVIASIRLAALLGAATLALSSAAQAGDVRILDEKASNTRTDGRCNVKITGKIDGPTIRYFRNQVDVFAEEKGAKILNSGEWGWNVCLASTEGDFAAGVELGTVLKDYYMGAVIMPGEKCLGACAIAFLGGAIKVEGRVAPLRMMHRTSILGFNAPSIDKETAAKDPVAAHRTAISVLLDMMTFMSEHRIDKTHLHSIRPIASTELIRQMLSYHGAEYYMIARLEDLLVLPVRVLDGPKLTLDETKKIEFCARYFVMRTPAFLTSKAVAERRFKFGPVTLRRKLTDAGAPYDVFVAGGPTSQTCQISSRPDADGYYDIGLADGVHTKTKILTERIPSYFALPLRTKLTELAGE
ncbi:MAG: hypothetical protein MRY74_04600 [Neomegalonema sp.]|nr:hypothetical protein [Neomegalonema sp.]